MATFQTGEATRCQRSTHASSARVASLSGFVDGEPAFPRERVAPARRAAISMKPSFTTALDESTFSPGSSGTRSATALPDGERRVTVVRTCQMRPNSSAIDRRRSSAHPAGRSSPAPAAVFCFSAKKTCASGTPSGRTPVKVQPGASIFTCRGLSRKVHSHSVTSASDPSTRTRCTPAARARPRDSRRRGAARPRVCHRRAR